MRLRHGRQTGEQARSAGGAAARQDPQPPSDRTHASYPRLPPCGAATYGYNALNQLVGATVGGTTTALAYDPADRLYQLGTTRFLYDGPQAIAEYNTSNVLQRRFVPGPGTDEVVAVYEGSGVTNRSWPLQDERGSGIASTSGAGAASGINTYDEYGRPAAGNTGRFQYTGQMWLSQAGVYHYKARAYEPNLGRFLQTDPVGYEDGLNLYAYVQNDPVNATDPDGQACVMFNGWSPYCRRAELYRRYDQALGGHTRFFAAAARTVTFFASGDFPVGGQILGSRGSTRRNFAALSARLERLNNAAARQIESGALRGRGLDAVLVHREQSAEQNFLENLQGSAPDEYAAMVSAANAFINGGNSLWPSDWNYLGVIGSVRSALGRDIDFTNQGDREAIGNALVEAVRSSCLRPPEQGGCSARQ